MKKFRSHITLFFFIFSLSTIIFVSGCSNGDNEALARKFLFGMHYDSFGQENFVAITKDKNVIELLQKQLALPVSERNFFTNGPIARGNGGHNLEWDWHYLENSWEMVEVSIELCDGTPTLVNESIDYWVDTVGQFCPWGAYVIQELE